MTNKDVSSAPLFGSSTPQQIREIEGEIEKATNALLASKAKRRAMLIKLGLSGNADDSGAN